MQYLSRLETSPESSLYAIGGEYESAVNRYIVSTPETRAICNQPEILGHDYTNRLRTAVSKALLHSPIRSLFEGQPEHRVCVLNFLRGGLNFDLRGALHDALGMNRHASAFMSSQRWRGEDGRWQVREDMYRKLQIPRGATLVVGDVVATGITVEHGLDVLIDHLKSAGASLRHLLFLTIGSHKLEKTLASCDARFREAFSDYRGTHAVHFEGKFKLVDARTELQIGIPGTDLIRRDCLLAPEFEASQWDRIAFPLERCTIYDAGARAFDIPSYVGDVLEYWMSVQELAGQGLTLQDVLDERWPDDDYRSIDTFLERRGELWRDVDEDFARELYQGYQSRWPDMPKAGADTSEALSRVCAERIETLRSHLE